MTKFVKIFIFTMVFFDSVTIYAQTFYKVSHIPKEKIKYIKEYVDSNNREIQFDQSFMVCLKNDCFYVVPNQAKKDDYDFDRYSCSVNIIDKKYDSKKDVDLIAQNKIDTKMNEEMDEKTWRRIIFMWHKGPSYEAIMNNNCDENPSFGGIAFINEKENERPIILVAQNPDGELINKNTGYEFHILYFDGVKYRLYLNEKLEKYLENKKLTVGKSIMVVKREIENWLKNNKK